MTHINKQQPTADIIRHEDRAPTVSHATRMAARRKRQLARTEGFTPIRNLKIVDAVTKTMASLIAANAAARAAGEDVRELTNEAANRLAWQQVAATLPAERIGYTRNRVKAPATSQKAREKYVG